MTRKVEERTNFSPELQDNVSMEVVELRASKSGRRVKSDASQHKLPVLKMKTEES